MQVKVDSVAPFHARLFAVHLSNEVCRVDGVFPPSVVVAMPFLLVQLYFETFVDDGAFLNGDLVQVGESIELDHGDLIRIGVFAPV